MTTLYRKYRPQKFSEAVGQNHIKLTIQGELATGKIAHAFLFCGPRAVGKTTFARLLAKSVNCLNRKDGEFEPCDKCDSCQDIILNRSLDIIEMDAASNTGVDNVRENIISSARISPSRSKYKVFIIDEVHMLSVSAFNALLKVLEEPPARVIFILCTTETHKVPATIISRCERFDFKRIGFLDIIKKLSHIVREEKIKVSPEILEAIARHSEGHMRDAESLLGQLLAISDKEITMKEADLVIPRSDIGEIVNLIEFLVKKDASSGIALINKLLDDGVDLEKFAGDLIELLRRLLISKINPYLGEKIGLEIGESFELKINEIKKDFPIERIIIALEKLLIAKKEMKNSFITQLPLEMALAELCFESSRMITSAPAAASFSKPADNISASQYIKKNSSAANQIVSDAPIVEKKDAPSVCVENICVDNICVGGEADVCLDLNSFISRWNEVLAKVKKHNHSLSVVLRTCQPKSINGNKVCFVFKYKFHRDRVGEARMKEIIQNTLKEVYGANLTFETIIDESLELEAGSNSSESFDANIPVQNMETENIPPPEEQSGPAEGGDMMSNLLKTFGGKIIG